MVILFLIAGVCLILGVLFMLSQDTLSKLDAFLNKSITTFGNTTDKNKDKAIGVFLIIFALALAVIGLYLRR